LLLVVCHARFPKPGSNPREGILSDARPDLISVPHLWPVPVTTFYLGTFNNDEETYVEDVSLCARRRERVGDEYGWHAGKALGVYRQRIQAGLSGRIPGVTSIAALLI
jgi:hypothetical protein